MPFVYVDGIARYYEPFCCCGDDGWITDYDGQVVGPCPYCKAGKDHGKEKARKHKPPSLMSDLTMVDGVMLDGHGPLYR